MVLYDLRSHFSERSKSVIGKTYVFSVFMGLLLSVYFLLVLGYYENGTFVTVYGALPIYLAIFYLASCLLVTLFLHSKGYGIFESSVFGFLIAYVSSFYWEIPENIYWQIVRGYHPAILFVLIGAFPYIWLDKKLGWKKNMNNILLVLLGWASTTFGVLTMESNIYTTPSGGIYFLFCRVVCLLVLIRIFTSRRTARYVPSIIL